MSPVFLTLEDALAIHRRGLEDFGGADGIRDLAALESALGMPQAGFGEDYFHKTLPEMAAAYLFHLAQNHGFVDGNKRVALGAAHVFLGLNGLELTATEAELKDIVMKTAAGKAGKKKLATFFSKKTRKISV